MWSLILAVFFAAQAAGESRGVTALCYHQVVPNPDGRFELSVDAFREQLRLLRARGYTGINSQQLLDYLAGRFRPLKKPVLLTFDDGFRSVYEYAFPVMQEFGFVGVVCVYPQFIGSRGAMSWEQLRKLIDAGWSVEAHSMTHANLWRAPVASAARQAFFEREIALPKKIIEERLGEPVRFFAWPYGIYTEETEAFARQAGYAGAFTTDGGANYPGLDPFRVKRQVIYRTDTRDKFLIRLGMAPLELTALNPRPGQVVKSLATISCVLPPSIDMTPGTYVLNAKITGGRLSFAFDPATRKVTASVKGRLSPGHRFINIFLRDARTGITRQHGWLVTIGASGAAATTATTGGGNPMDHPAIH